MNGYELWESDMTEIARLRALLDDDLRSAHSLAAMAAAGVRAKLRPRLFHEAYVDDLVREYEGTLREAWDNIEAGLSALENDAGSRDEDAAGDA